jgi:hypothetical protein
LGCLKDRETQTLENELLTYMNENDKPRLGDMKGFLIALILVTLYNFLKK